MGEIVTGDFAKLDLLIAKLDAIGKPPALRELAGELGHEQLLLVSEGFSGKHGPDGSSWAPRVIADTGQVGTKTGALRFGYGLRRVSERGTTIGPTNKARRYGGFFHRGRGAIEAKPGSALRFTAGGRTFFRKSVGPSPARPIVPGNSLPARWATRLQARADRWFLRRMTF